MREICEMDGGDHFFRPGEPCPVCGEIYFFDLLQAWPGERAWMFETCCEAANEKLIDDLEYACELPMVERLRFLAPLRQLFEFHGLDLRLVYVDHAEMAIRMDFGLELRDVSQAEAKAFIRAHHRHNAPPAGWRWGKAAFNGDDMVAVTMVGRPVARVLPQDSWVEVNRLCVNPELPAELVWNACSLLYTDAFREAKARGFEKIITYTMADEETGASLKASGWTPENVSQGGSWDRPSRARADKAPTTPKVRWARTCLSPRAAAQVRARLARS